MSYILVSLLQNNPFVMQFVKMSLQTQPLLVTALYLQVTAQVCARFAQAVYHMCKPDIISLMTSTKEHPYMQ